MLVADEDQALALCTAVPGSARPAHERVLARAAHPGPAPPARPGRRPRRGGRHHRHPCPAHPVPLAICRQMGPIATTSANRHHEPPLTTAQEVAESLGAELASSSTPGPAAPCLNGRRLHRGSPRAVAGGPAVMGRDPGSGPPAEQPT